MSFAAWTETELRNIYRGYIKAGYQCAFFEEGDPWPWDKTVWWRHDIDLCLDAAIWMGEVEADEGITSTFFLMHHSEHYNLSSPKGVRVVKKLRELGHRVSQHVDLWNGDVIERDVVSFHRPEDYLLGAIVPNVISTYEPRFFTDATYLSDSLRTWRSGHPLSHIGTSDKLQILLHPALWFSPGDSWEAVKIHHERMRSDAAWDYLGQLAS